jgi:hypothetical protein
MKRIIKNVPFILFCLAVISITVLCIVSKSNKDSIVNEEDFVEEEIHEEIKWNVSYDISKMSKYILSDEELEEQFYLNVIPKEYGDAFLYYSRDRKEMRPYFYALMVHESNNFTAFVNKNKDGSYDYGPSQLNSNNIKNEKFRNWYNPKDESHITSKYCFYMVMTMNFYWDLVNKYGYDYAFYAYNGGERTVKLIKNKSSLYASLIKTVKLYDKNVRLRMIDAEINREEFIATKRTEHMNQIASIIRGEIKLESNNNINLVAFTQDSLNKSNKSGYDEVLYIRRDDLLQFEIKEGTIIGKTIIGTFNI